MACQGKQILADDRHFMKRKELEGMRPEDLNRLLRSESESVEWTRSLGEWKEIVVASAALASLHGGQICIGVEPTGKVCGVEAGKGTLEDLANKIAQSTSPRLIPSISAIERDRKTIVVVSVPESTPKPVCAFDRPVKIRSDQRIASPYGETRTCPYGKSGIDCAAWRRSELLV
jgi:predicted HTH transcriptional regulator